MMRIILTMTWNGLVRLMVFLNPLPLLHYLGQFLYTIGVITIRTSVQTITVTAKFLGQSAVFTGNLLFQILTTIVRFILHICWQTMQLISFLLRTLFTATIQTGTFLVVSLIRGVTFSYNFTAQIVIITTRYIFQTTVMILHLIDPRPLIFRIISGVSYRIMTIHRAIIRTETAIWTVLSPPLLYVRDAVVKAAGDLRFEKLPTTQAAEESSVTYSTNNETLQ
jgi:hypothetical protein